MSARVRTASATVHVDPVIGSNSFDGTSATPSGGGVGPVQTLQCAFDYAHGNFDISPPWAWTNCGNVGYRTIGVTIQMAPVSAANAERLTQPVYLDGAGPAGPITLRGDPANPLNYNVYAANSLQGLTSQNGAHLICEGFTIRGDANSTLINSLAAGKIAVKNVWVGQGSTGACNVAGAAGGSQLDVIGNITLIGSGFTTVFSAIESSRIVLAPNHSITVNNAMNFGIAFNLMHASAWTQGSPLVFNGTGLAASTGVAWNAYYGALLGFNRWSIPGAAGSSDSTSVVL